MKKIIVFIWIVFILTINNNINKLEANTEKLPVVTIDKVKKANEAKIAVMIEESKMRIAEQEKKSRSEIEKATLETIKLISARFIDKMPSDDDIVKKLN